MLFFRTRFQVLFYSNHLSDSMLLASIFHTTVSDLLTTESKQEEQSSFFNSVSSRSTGAKSTSSELNDATFSALSVLESSIHNDQLPFSPSRRPPRRVLKKHSAHCPTLAHPQVLHSQILLSLDEDIEEADINRVKPEETLREAVGLMFPS